MSEQGAPDPLDVTELYDAFHAVAELIWRRFGFLQAGVKEHPMLEPAYDEIIDQLEVDLFLPACARHAYHERGVLLDPEDVPDVIVLRDAADTALVGAAARYHSHAFHPAPGATEVPNEVLAGNLMPRRRDDVRLLLDPAGARQDPVGQRRPDLRVI
jgi:hypothetical protein